VNRPDNQSLRRKLLFSLLPALLVLITIDTTILYHVARRFVQQQFDGALYDSTRDILHVIKREGAGAHALNLPELVREVILSDPYDKVFYSISDAHGRVISGEPALRPARSAPVEGRAGHRFFYSTIHGLPVRVASVYADINVGAVRMHHIHIEVAQTLRRRDQLNERILTGIIVPQLLLVLLAAALVWYGIGRGLSPLNELEDALSRRSPRDLSAVRLSHVPTEVRTVVAAINALLVRLSGVIESQNRFIADAAHQLRTPIAGIQAQLSLALSDERHIQNSLDRACDSVQRLGHLANQLLALARSQPEVARTLSVRSIDLTRLAQEKTIEQVPTAYGKDIDLGFEATSESVWVEGDRQLLAELLSNLIDNAVRYTPRGGQVTVALESRGGEAILSVQDDGPGIPESERERVFERFHRIVGSGEDGSGLGLSIVREIAELHNAKVALMQPEDGRGTRVEVTLVSLIGTLTGPERGGPRPGGGFETQEAGEG